MAGLNVAMINGIRPMQGSGDGITEYAYRMYLQLMKMHNNVELVYSIGRAKKNDAIGLLKVNSTLNRRAMDAAKMPYDIFHIVNQEVGFAARGIKSVNRHSKVVTTIHDISRFEKGLHRGLLQKAYNSMVKASITAAIKHSDYLMFDSQQTMDDVKRRFGFDNGSVVNIGIEDIFRAGKLRTKKGKFIVGYVGSFAYHKNVIMLLRAAKCVARQDVHFQVYGVGNEEKNLAGYKKQNRIGNLELMGFAGEDRKVGIYDKFSVFVFPSMYEGFGLPILEAQARGLPVVIYKHGRISAEIRKYCFEAKDEYDMARIIIGLKDRGYDQRRRKAAMAYARSFTWEKCAKETLKAYNKILNA